MQPTDERIRKKRGFRNPMLFVGVVMILFYIVLGAWILLDKTFLLGINEELRNIFAVLLLIYGTYRGWRIWADYF